MSDFRTCAVPSCGALFRPYRTQKVCSPECRAEDNRRRAGKWRRENPDREKARKAEYRKRNKENVAERKARYYRENREQELARSAQWREENRGHVREYQARYRSNNRAKARSYHKDYREKHRAEMAAYVREYRKRNRKRINRMDLAKWHRRRAKELAGSVSEGIREQLLKRQKGRCVACGANLKECGSHLDHIRPLSRGGPHEDANLQLLCPACNLSKSDRDPVEFMQENGFLL